MTKHKCFKCGSGMWEKETNSPNVKVQLICGACTLNTEKRLELGKEAQTWREKKTIEILNKEEPTEMDKIMLKRWNKS